MNNFVFFATKTRFLEAKVGEEYNNTSIVFIADSKEIWNRGIFYASPIDFDINDYLSKDEASEIYQNKGDYVVYEEDGTIYLKDIYGTDTIKLQDALLIAEVNVPFVADESTCSIYSSSTQTQAGMTQFTYFGGFMKKDHKYKVEFDNKEFICECNGKCISDSPTFSKSDSNVYLYSMYGLIAGENYRSSSSIKIKVTDLTGTKQRTTLKVTNENGFSDELIMTQKAVYDNYASKEMLEELLEWGEY